jgi:hypothetical protein
LDNSQLKPYRDPEFIEKIANFFLTRTTENEKWMLSVGGGEPLLMPNFGMLVDKLGSKGNKVGIYTALLVGDNNPALRYLFEGGARHTDYLMVSFHPEAEEREEQHFDRLRRLKQAGHSVIFRFVGHPKRLHRLDELAARCRELDIAFHPTPLFSPEYPTSYSAEERRMLESHMCSLSQMIQLNNGIDTARAHCTARTDLMAVYLRTGNITPCITTQGPILGNIYENTLTPIGHVIKCPLNNESCICDVHFQQAIVVGADDRAAFAAEKIGYVAPGDVAEMTAKVVSSGNEFSKALPSIGQTKTAEFEALPTAVVKAAFLANKEWMLGHYTASNHAEFQGRQRSSTADIPAAEKDIPAAEKSDPSFLSRIVAVLRR